MPAPYPISELEIDAVSARAAAERYAHFLDRVAGTGVMWGLRASDGAWVRAASMVGGDAMPLWPHPRYAEACAVGAWAGATPDAIEVAAWLRLPEAEHARRDGMFAVFPVPGCRGLELAPERLFVAIAAADARFDHV